MSVSRGWSAAGGRSRREDGRRVRKGPGRPVFKGTTMAESDLGSLEQYSPATLREHIICFHKEHTYSLPAEETQVHLHEIRKGLVDYVHSRLMVFSLSGSGILQGRTWSSACSEMREAQGHFSTCPEVVIYFSRSGLLLVRKWSSTWPEVVLLLSGSGHLLARICA